MQRITFGGKTDKTEKFGKNVIVTLYRQTLALPHLDLAANLCTVGIAHHLAACVGGRCPPYVLRCVPWGARRFQLMQSEECKMQNEERNPPSPPTPHAPRPTPHDSGPTPPVRVGILGFGMIGKVHAFGYRTLPFYYDPLPLEARITHVVTSRLETARQACRIVGAEVAATDYRMVTENPADRHCPYLHPQPLPQKRPAFGDRAAKAHLLRQAPGGHLGRGGAGPRGVGRLSRHGADDLPVPILSRNHARPAVDRGGSVGQDPRFPHCYLHGGSAARRRR